MASLAIALPVGDERPAKLNDPPLVHCVLGVVAVGVRLHHWGLGFRQSSFRPLTRVLRDDTLAPSGVSPSPACSFPLRLSPSGEPDGPETSLRVSPDWVRDSAPRSAAHPFLAPGSSVICPLSWAPCRACDLHCWRLPLTGHPYIALMACSRPLQRYSSRSPDIPPSPRQHIRWLSQRPWLLGESHPRRPHPVDTSLIAGAAITGLLRSSSPFAAERRTPLFAGFLGSVSESAADPLSPYPCLLAVANHPRRLLPRHDDSAMGSAAACPYSALLGGIPGRIPSDRH